MLWAAVPRSSAITVLPELFPDSVRALAATGTAAPQGTNLLAALHRARAALGPADREPTPAAPDQVVAELVHEGDAWRLGYAGRTVRVRDMKGIGDLVVLVSRPHVEVHTLELMGGTDVGGAAGPVLDDVARREYQARIVELQREIDGRVPTTTAGAPSGPSSSSTRSSSSSAMRSGSAAGRARRARAQSVPARP